MLWVKRPRFGFKWFLLFPLLLGYFFLINKLVSNDKPLPNPSYQPSVASPSPLLPFLSCPFSSEACNASSAESKCGPKRHIFFLKTHKCGSSSLQNILLRFGDTNGLLFVIPKTKNYMGHPQPFNRRMVPSPTLVKRRTNETYSIFAHHSRLDVDEVKAIMPLDTLFITVVRDPVQMFESVYVYYDLGRIYGKNMTLIQFLEATDKLDMETNYSSQWSFSRMFTKVFSRYAAKAFNPNNRLNGKYGRNQMAFDLGLDVSCFDNTLLVKDFIAKLDSAFHLVLVAERMDESLILLKHMLCWSVSDIIAFKHNPRSDQFHVNLTEKNRASIRRLNRADQMLYQHFAERFNEKVIQFGEKRMEREVAELRAQRDLLYARCVSREQIMTKSAANRFWFSSRVLVMETKNSSDPLCLQLTRAELLYTEMIRKKQNSRLRPVDIRRVNWPRYVRSNLV